jgi:hypothetical protein
VNDDFTPVEQVLDRLADHTEHRGEYRARCPAHRGQSDNSLSIKEGEEGRALLVCHAGCEYQEIVEALGLSVGDLFADNGWRGGAGRAKKVRTKTKGRSASKTLTTDQLPRGTYWEFTSPAGEVLYIQRHKREYYWKVGEDRWVTYRGVLDDIAQVLYRLPELIDGVRFGKTVYHLEGPKDVETARGRLGVVATTSGSTSSWMEEFRSFYTGANTVVIPDNDAPGLQYAEKVARDVVGVAKSLKVVQLPGLGEGQDLTDWLEAGHTAEEFFRVVEEAPPYDPEREAPWPEPRELDTALPPVADLTKSMLPEPLAEWIFDEAERMERVPADFVATDVIVALASLVGRKLAIRPKQKDPWSVVPNLWGATVGRPASMKSPAQKAALKPLSRLSARATEAFQGAEEEWKTVTRKVEQAEEQALKKELEAAARAVAKRGDGNRTEVNEVAEKLRSMEREPEPVHKRYDTNDSTIERLTELLRDNPNGLLLHRDELMGWLRSLDRPGHESDRAFFLEAWAGNSSFKADRIERGFVYAPAVCLSLIGSIQPGPLGSYVADALTEAEKADGLLQRFQLVVWPDPKPYNRVDRAPNLEAASAANAIFEALDGFDATKFGATEEEGEVPYVRFAPKAQEVFDAWRDEFEPQYLAGEYPAALEAHFAKYRSLFASLSLIFEVVAFVSGESEGYAVSERSAWRAAAWCEFLESHAKRLYHPALMAPTMAASSLLEKIEGGAVTHRMKLRLVVDKGWEGLNTTEKVREAVAILEDHGWVRLVEVKSPGRGRPSEQLHIHPNLREEV